MSNETFNPQVTSPTKLRLFNYLLRYLWQARSKPTALTLRATCMEIRGADLDAKVHHPPTGSAGVPAPKFRLLLRLETLEENADHL